MTRRTRKIHGFDGSCRPDGPHEFIYGAQRTFSLGVFEIIPKNNGNGTKRGKVLVRVSGDVSNHKAVVARAREIMEELDAGIYSGPKTVKVRTAQ